MLDGGALIAYSGLAEGGERDIRVARLQGRRWEDRHVLDPDNWIIAARPGASLGGGPAIDVDGGRVVAAWFTGADGDPRLQVSTSPDAGGRFLMPLRLLDSRRAEGPPAAAILHDGAAILVGRETHGAGPDTIWLRRATPEFGLDPPLSLGAAAPVSPLRIARVRDFAGDWAPARLIVAFAGPAGDVRTLLVSVPEGALLAAAEENCHCGLPAQDLLGYPVSGTVAAVSPEALTLTVDTGDVPGVMDAGRHVFFAARDEAASAEIGRTYLARLERRNGAWWWYDARPLDPAR